MKIKFWQNLINITLKINKTKYNLLYILIKIYNNYILNI